MARIDYERMSDRYERGRGLPIEALGGWRDVIREHLPADARRVVDVGSGTGIFAAAIAEWFDIDVVGVEPADGMRREAARTHAHPRVSYAGGEAEHLPLRDATCSLAWLSTVIHHFRDLPAAAREGARVLRPQGVVLIRSAFAGRLDGISLFTRFPTAARIAESFPSIEETRSAFEAAGLRMTALESVQQVSAPSLRAYLERVRTRADTTLTLISDAEYEAGLAALERDAAAETEPMPIIDTFDLLVLERAGT